MSRTKSKVQPAHRKPAPRFHLTGLERMFLALYRAVPDGPRIEAGRILFNAWTRGSRDPVHASLIDVRWKAAEQALKLGPLSIDLFDEVTGHGIGGGAR